MVMHPVVRDELLRNDHVSRLQANCSLISSKPFQSFEDLGSAADEMVILISSWGCPRIDTKVLDNLKASETSKKNKLHNLFESAK